jgi:hypothetical protein
MLFPLQVVLHRLNFKGETSMKRFAMALVLACALSGTALAGDVPSTGSASQPPSTVVAVILTILSIVA